MKKLYEINLLNKNYAFGVCEKSIKEKIEYILKNIFSIWELLELPEYYTYEQMKKSISIIEIDKSRIEILEKRKQYWDKTHMIMCVDKIKIDKFYITLKI